MPAGQALTSETIAMLLQGFASTHVGLCLCDEADAIRYVNETFRARFMPHYRGEGGDFVETIAAAIAAGTGIRLESMPLSAFVPRVKARRREAPSRYDFTVDLQDGSWWWVNDHKMANGWMLVVASDTSRMKDEELRLRDAHASALRAAQTDFLTGVPNRRHGFELAEVAIAAGRLQGRPLAIGVIDIDHFKGINDTYGHEVGDQVLVHFAQALRQEMRVRDQISRIGGEEFLAVFPATKVEQAVRALERMLRRVPPLTLEASGAELPICASAGIVSVGRTQELREALVSADAALYRAKAGGRGRIVSLPA